MDRAVEVAFASNFPLDGSIKTVTFSALLGRHYGNRR